MRAKNVANESKCKCEAPFPGGADVSSALQQTIAGVASCSVLILRVCGRDTLRPAHYTTLHVMTAFVLLHATRY